MSKEEKEVKKALENSNMVLYDSCDAISNEDINFINQFSKWAKNRTDLSQSEAEKFEKKWHNRT